MLTLEVLLSVYTTMLMGYPINRVSTYIFTQGQKLYLLYEEIYWSYGPWVSFNILSYNYSIQYSSFIMLDSICSLIQWCMMSMCLTRSLVVGINAEYRLFYLLKLMLFSASIHILLPAVESIAPLSCTCWQLQIQLLGYMF